MVLRKRAPPHLSILGQGDAPAEFRSDPLSSTPKTAPTVKPPSLSSPKRLTRPRRAQSSPHPHRVPSLQSVYSPDLRTSPAFNLMPLEQAQKSPIRNSPGGNTIPWTEELVERPGQSRPQSVDSAPRFNMESNTHNEGPVDERKGQGRVPSILVAGNQRRVEDQQASAYSQGGEYVGQPPVQLQSNNPFLKAQQNHLSNPPSRASDAGASFISQDGTSSLLGQDEGYIPMTARISLVDESNPEKQSATDMSNATAQYQHPGQSQPPVDQVNNDQYVALPMSASDPLRPMSYDGQLSAYMTPQSGKLSPSDGGNTPATPSTPATGSSHVLVELDQSLRSEPSPAKAQGPNPAEVPSSNSELDKQQEFHKDPGNPPSLPERSVTGPSGAAVFQPRRLPPLSEAEEKRQREQRSETYAIRHINWKDSTGKMRESPILVQNKNGPCPLLALVNTLVLRASENNPPPIVRALQTKEQISLGLLIEALFDELTTRLGPEDELPDIEALSRFLTMLHTGMNVNPRLTLTWREALGSFEATDDIQLYGTFGVPLVHGWVAAPRSEADYALARLGQYHEDIQLLPFRKHELEDRTLRGESLSPEDEQVLKDIQTIEQFTDIENATQLSDFGLEHLIKKLAPGSFSILFRNDHFSTLYKDPRYNRLFTLITDAGYSSHAEIVWESLVDVNGAISEFYSGDFRSVDHSQSHSSPVASDPSGPRTSSTTFNPPVPRKDGTLTAQEQADADFAYALSLQYQEEERERTAVNRSRTQAPSTSTSATQNNRTTSQASGQGRRPTTTRQFFQPQRGNTEDDGPPPPYEQAAKTPEYSPERGSHLAAEVPSYTPYTRNQYGRRPPSGAVGAGLPDRSRDRNKDCVVM